MPNEIELIKNKLDVVEFIRSYVNLVPAGKNFKALCPFHQEKTPSFIVSPERQLWHCFGACGEGGDIIKFLMKYENIDFIEALKILAEKAGIELKVINSVQQREINIIYDLQEKAKDFFREQLWHVRSAFDYLVNERGLTKSTIEEFELGFSPGGDMLTLHLIKLGYDVADIVKAGLAFKNSKGFYRDRFQGRLIFPIFNHSGRAVAFTGRLMPSNLKENIVENLAARPKYLNSPETLIFNKSKILYGFNKSKQEIIKSQSAFLVEGQMDFLMAWQAGIRNAVAVSGSALSRHHLQTLRRFADTLFLSFDNDEAGIKALERSLDLLGAFDFNIKVIDLGGFKDPAEAVKVDKNFLIKALNEARTAFSHLLNFHFSSAAELEPVLKKRKIYHFLALIRKLKNPLDQHFWLKELARRMAIPEETLRGELEKFNLQSSNEIISMATEKIEERRSRLEVIAQRLITLAFAFEEGWEILRQHQSYFPETFQSLIINPQDPAANELSLRAIYEFSETEPEKIKNELQELIFQLKMEFLKNKQSVLKNEISLVQRRNESVHKLNDLLEDFRRVTEEINQLNAAKSGRS